MGSALHKLEQDVAEVQHQTQQALRDNDIDMLAKDTLGVWGSPEDSALSHR